MFNALTHWGRDKMAAIFQTTFSNTFSWMKAYELRLKFHSNLFLRVQSVIFHHWFRYWFGADQATSHYLNKWWLGYWRIYVTRPQWVKWILDTQNVNRIPCNFIPDREMIIISWWYRTEPLNMSISLSRSQLRIQIALRSATWNLGVLGCWLPTRMPSPRETALWLWSDLE